MAARGDGTEELLPGLTVPRPPARARSAGKVGRPRAPAGASPVARVALDVSLAHLDRPFDYLVPAELDSAAVAGCRIRVRFAGRLVDGFLLERAGSSEHEGTLAYLDKVVSSEQVLTAEIARLARTVADRYAGTLADVLRLAVPARHARVEAEAGAASRRVEAEAGAASRPVEAEAGAATRLVEAEAGAAAGEAAHWSAPEGSSADARAWQPYQRGPEFLAALSAPPIGHQLGTDASPRTPIGDQLGSGHGGSGHDVGSGHGGSGHDEGSGHDNGSGRDTGSGHDTGSGRDESTESPRAVMTMLPGEDWPARLAEAIASTVHSGRGAVAVVPDARDLARMERALETVIGADRFVALHAALGPAERYRRFLRASRGDVSVVVGTRAAAFAPVPRLGLVVIWDDGDDLHAEPRAPYPHALQVLLLRAQLAGAGALVAATARSAEAQLLIETRWAQEIVAPREIVRQRAPAVSPTGDDADRARDEAAVTARLPSLAWRTARDALAAGAPVLVQVPRRGYVPSVSCVECHAPARCARCAGPLELRSSHAIAACRWCGRPAADYACHRCGQRRLRASVVGAGRTAEELGRAFPGVPVRTSGRDHVLSYVDSEPALVVATPGAEPIAPGGYGAVLLLDTWALLTRADLRAGEETLRRWLAAASLARPATAGGTVVVVADGGLAPVQALLRWDPATLAARELAERRELGFPPAARMASLTGPADGVAELLGLAELPAGTEALGPVPVGEEERVLVRVASRSAGAALAAALHAASGVRSARKAEGSVRVQVDPRELW